MTVEQKLSQLDPRCVHSQAVAIAQQQAISETAPNRVPDVVADDRADDGSDNYECNVQPVRRSGVDRRGHERRFARYRKSHALEPTMTATRA